MKSDVIAIDNKGTGFKEAVEATKKLAEFNGLNATDSLHLQLFTILLAICPSSHRGEDLLPKLEVFWNLRLNLVSFCPSLFFLSQFPAHWASCHFHCAGFPLRSASSM